MPALVEHLRARLGADAVYGIRRVSEHRPENAWRVAEPALAPGTLARLPPAMRSVMRRSAVRCGCCTRRRRSIRSAAGRVMTAHCELLSGPERIESGWWDGGDVQRDYYVAQRYRAARVCGSTANARGARRWFLHGIFG